MKVFPISLYTGVFNQIQSIPWDMIDAHERQAYLNHQKLLPMLAEKGGLTANEAVAILEDKARVNLLPQQSVDRLKELVNLYLCELNAQYRQYSKSRPKIVCICGSSRFCDRAAVRAWELEKQGIMAIGMTLLPDWYPNVKPHHMAEQEGVADIMDALHMKKVEMADSILVVNVDGYIGERTRLEIEYAQSLGKPVHYVEPI